MHTGSETVIINLGIKIMLFTSRPKVVYKLTTSIAVQTGRKTTKNVNSRKELGKQMQ